MRKISFILIIILCLTLTGCKKLATVDFYISDNLVKTLYSSPQGTIPEYYPKDFYEYDFDGWYTNDGTAFDFATPLTGNYIVKGRFISRYDGSITQEPTAMEQLPINANFSKYGDTGEVTKVMASNKGYYIEAKGYYGYHMDEHPYMRMGVLIDKQGQIFKVIKIEDYHQSQGYADAITTAYLDDKYKNEPCSKDIQVMPVSGATATSTAVVYAVATCGYYAEKALGIAPDTNTQDKELFNKLYPSNYTTINSSYQVNPNVGEVLYSCQGDGVIALKVKGSRKIVTNGSYYQGWDSQVPRSYVMAIIVDTSTDKIIAYNVIIDGASRPNYFTVPEDKHLAYQTIAITSPNVFDTFEGGLVDRKLYPTSELYDGDYFIGTIITGTSILYTGATTNGTYSSQIVRNCYRTVAYYYCNYQ